MKTVCELNSCTGCMVCLEVCGKNAIIIQDSMQNYNAVIDESKCVKCGLCTKVCQNVTAPELSAPRSWKQGWANNQNIRATSSSGGFATAISESFVKSDGIVCSCSFYDGKFIFEFASSLNDVSKFSGSKYVKSNPKGIYKKIKKYLQQGKKVLFIGLPCQVAAVKLFVANELQKNLYTIDLICHGSPSPKNLQNFMMENGVNLKDIADIQFRKKDIFRVFNSGNAIEPLGVYDRYTLAFLNCLNYTENCYNCRYATLNRVSDITIGDSWGSNLSEEEVRKGISLALCQTSKGEELLNNADLKLFEVDLNNAVSHNHQLEKPSIKPKTYDKFFSAINSGVAYNTAVMKALPRTCINQNIKKLLIKLRILRGG